MEQHLDTMFGVNATYGEARLVLWGAPFDSTTSFRPGTRFAPRTMRGESYGLENYSPYQDRDLSDAAIFDAGDLELPLGDSRLALTLIERQTAEILADDKFPLLIGGEHLVSLGAIRAVRRKYPALRIIHFDAHTDLRDEYLGVNLSHASVIRRAWDVVGDGKICQFGIRSGDADEFVWAKKHTLLHKFDFVGLTETVSALKDYPVYLTVDLDVMDPSVFPGTGTPEAGGVDFTSLLDAIFTVVNGARVVGMDMVELCPSCDASGASTAVALKLLRETMIALEKNHLSPVGG